MPPRSASVTVPAVWRPPLTPTKNLISSISIALGAIGLLFARLRLQGIQLSRPLRAVQILSAIASVAIAVWNRIRGPSNVLDVKRFDMPLFLQDELAKFKVRFENNTLVIPRPAKDIKVSPENVNRNIRAIAELAINQLVKNKINCTLPNVDIAFGKSDLCINHDTTQKITVYTCKTSDSMHIYRASIPFNEDNEPQFKTAMLKKS